jgi:hypothetical protein
LLILAPELTGSAPEPTSGSAAGLTHEWLLETKYYTTTLPIWVDEVTDLTEWRTAFTAPEAREVITALGAWIFCFRKPVSQADLSAIKDTMQAIADSIERACGFSGDQVCLAVAMPQSTTPYLDMPSEEWEDICTDTGFEYVDFEKTGKNEFGENVGVQRVRESLEAGEWESVEGLDFADGEDGEEGFDGFAAEEAEMNMELFGMKGALHGFGDEEGGENEPTAEEEAKEVEELEVMMRKMIAIKGTSRCHQYYSGAEANSSRNGRRHGRSRTQTLCCKSRQRSPQRPLNALFITHTPELSLHPIHHQKRKGHLAHQLLHTLLILHLFPQHERLVNLDIFKPRLDQQPPRHILLNPMMLHPRPLLHRMKPNCLLPKILIIRQCHHTPFPQALEHRLKNTFQILNMMQRQMRYHQIKSMPRRRFATFQRRTRALHFRTIGVGEEVVNGHQIRLFEILQFSVKRRYHTLCCIDAQQRMNMWCEGE